MRRRSTDLALNGGEPCRREPFEWPIYGDAERQSLIDVVESGRWGFEGPKEAALAQALETYLQVPFAFLVSSGTVALEIAIQALDIGPGDEVIVPALTWTAPARAVVVAGASVVFADVRRDNWCLDTDAVVRAISSRTRAILLVHTYSHMCDMDGITEIAADRGILVIEDCAHALGSRWRQMSAGVLGTIGCFSFQMSKTMTAGEGGLVVTADPRIADRLYGLKNCGRKRTAESDFGFGGNYRITEFQAAILISQLSRLDGQLANKAHNALVFESAIGELPGISVCPPHPHVTKRSYFGLSVNVDTSAFSDVPTRLLVTALAAEGIPVFMPHQVVYRSPMWTSGVNTTLFGADRKSQVLGLAAECRNGERIASNSGVVIAHEAFLGPEDNVEDIVCAFAKVQALAGEIPVGAQDRRLILRYGLAAMPFN